MQKKGANISLKGYDDIFSTDQSRAEAQQERVQEIPLSDLHPFEGHPFRVVDDEEMLKTAESVREFGVLTPAIVRPDPDGGYEIISGHRRHRASELAGKETMQHSYCTDISWADAQPGDLVFYPDNSHVGIVGGRDANGELLIIHCASGYNNVVVTGLEGFTSIGRPQYYAEAGRS